MIFFSFLSLLSRFSRPNWLILPSESDQPIFLLTENSLSVASFSLSQEDFVAKVILEVILLALEVIVYCIGTGLW